MIDLKVNSVHWSPDETSVIVKFTEPVPVSTGQELRCYVRVPITGGETFLSALSRARAVLADTTVVTTTRKRAFN